MNKKGAIPLLILFAGIILVGAMYFGGVRLGELTGYDIVYKQNWGHICCVQHDDYDVKEGWYYADDRPVSECNDYTNECEYKFKYFNKPWYLGSGADVCYKVNGGNKQRISWGSPQIVKIDVGQEIEFVSCGLNQDARPYYQYMKKAKTFYIKGEENGKVYVTTSCVLSRDLKRKTLSGGKNELNFDECQNYMIDFVQVATKTYNYQGQEVICQARRLYEINRKQFKDGQVRKIQGEFITSVDCCPSENNCGSNFKFQENDKDTCTYSSECPNGGDLFIIGVHKAGQYKCIDGTCELEEKQVECSSTAECIERYGSNYVCDLSPNNFGNCVENPSPHYCGDGFCDVGETRENCPNDCELICLEGEKLVTKTRKDNCIVGFPLYIGCKEVIEKQCVPVGLNWWKILAMIGLGVIAAFILIKFAFPYLFPLIRRIIPF